jgi:hypothetical protein
MEGFPNQSFQLASVADLVELGAFMRAHHARARFLGLDLYFSLRQVVIVTGSSIFCTCCIPPFILLIYRHIFQIGFPRGGFIQGHVDQKYLCQIYACLEV